MESLTATEAARRFSELLDAVEERGETFPRRSTRSYRCANSAGRCSEWQGTEGAAQELASRCRVAARAARASIGTDRAGTRLERLILDTTVLVAAERDRPIGPRPDRSDRRTPAPTAISDDDDVAIAAITAAELLVGVEMARSGRRQRRATFVDSILSLVPVESYGLDAARAHARLLAHTRRAGRPRGAHDLPATASTPPRPP